MLAFKELIAPISNDQHEEHALSVLSVLGFPVTNWAADSVPRRIVRSFVELYADARAAVQSIALGGYLDTATGPWLTLLAKSQFDVDRLPASFAEIDCVLSAVPASGPHTIAPEQLVIASETTGHRFSNVDGGTLLPGGTLTPRWKAESAGSAFNAAAGTSMRIVAGTIAGVTAGAATLASSGANEETDPQLRFRCRTRWGSLVAPGNWTMDSWTYAALNVPTAPGIRRVFVHDNNPRGAGTLDIYLASETGAATDLEVAAASAYLAPFAGNMIDLVVQSAIEKIIPVEGTVYARTPAPTVAELEAAVTAYMSTLAIGGDRIPALSPARIMTDQIEVQMLSFPSVVTVDLTQPTGFALVLTDNQVGKPSFNLAVVNI